MTRFLFVVPVLTCIGCTPCSNQWAHQYFGYFDEYGGALVGSIALEVKEEKVASATDAEGCTACLLEGEFEGELLVGCTDNAGNEYQGECELEATLDGYMMPVSYGPMLADMAGTLDCDCGDGQIVNMKNAKIGGELDWGGDFKFGIEDSTDVIESTWGTWE